MIKLNIIWKRFRNIYIPILYHTPFPTRIEKNITPMPKILMLNHPFHVRPLWTAKIITFLPWQIDSTSNGKPFFLIEKKESQKAFSGTRELKIVKFCILDTTKTENRTTVQGLLDWTKDWSFSSSLEHQWNDGLFWKFQLQVADFLLIGRCIIVAEMFLSLFFF